MNLSYILKENFAEAQQVALAKWLTERALYQPLSDIADRFYALKPMEDKEGRVMQFCLEAEAFIALVSFWLQGQENDRSMGVNREKLAPVLVSMAVEALLHFGLKPAEVYRPVAAVVMGHAYLAEHHRDTYYRFTDWVQEKWLEIQMGDKKTYIDSLSCSPVYFIWQTFSSDKEKHVTFEFFINDLYHHWHRKIKISDIRRLFDSSPQPFTIEVPSKYLLEFLAVFYFMHQSRRIVCKNSKGIFVFMKQHLKPPEGDAYPEWADWSKMLYKQLSDPPKRKLLLSKIQAVLDKYCPGP